MTTKLLSCIRTPSSANLSMTEPYHSGCNGRYTNSETYRRAIKNKLGTNRSGYAHCLGHGSRTVDPTVLYEGGLAALSTSICTLHDELVPHDHHVSLSLLIRHVGALQEARQDINWRVRGGTLRQWRIVQQAKPGHEFDAILGQVTTHSLLQHITKLPDVGGGTPDQLRDPVLPRHCCREFTTTLGVQKPLYRSVPRKNEGAFASPYKSAKVVESRLGKTSSTNALFSIKGST